MAAIDETVTFDGRHHCGTMSTLDVFRVEGQGWRAVYWCKGCCKVLGEVIDPDLQTAITKAWEAMDKLNG